MRIIDFLAAKHGVHRLEAGDANGVVRELGLALAQSSQVDTEQLIDLLLHRERVGSTAVGYEVAMPHARTPAAAETVGVLGLSYRGVDFHAPDGIPVRLFVAFVSPIHGGRHLHAVAAVARELADPNLRKQLLDSSDAAEAYRVLGASTRHPAWRP